jgi:signal transduction histidine kinase
VRDDGVGFAAATLAQREAPPGPTGGFGLLGMRERLAALGGTLVLDNDGGARLAVSVPRAHAEAMRLTVAKEQT